MSEIPSRPPWDSKPPPPAGKDYLAEIGRMRQTSLAMSKAIDLCVTVLQQEVVIGKPKAPGADDEQAESASEVPPRDHPLPSSETIMALTALAHVRDVLAGKARTFDASVLSPLTESLDSGVFPSYNLPPPSPELASTSSSPPPPTAPSPLATPAPVAVAPPPRLVARSLSAESPTPPASNPSAGPPTPPLFLSARTDKPLPSLTRTPQLPPSQNRPIPAWESSRLGATAVAAKTTLPRPPPSASPHAPPLAAPRGGGAFPTAGFSTRSGRLGADPLGAIP